jgi:hypothetical protein
MSARELTAALLAFLGVYVLWSSMNGSEEIAFYLLRSPERILEPSTRVQGVLAVVYFFLLNIAFGAALILLRNRIATRLFPETPAAGTTIGVSELQAAAFAVLGLYFVVDSLSSVLWNFMRLAPDESVDLLWTRHSGVILRGVLGIALFLGARGAAGAWWLARRAGQSR